MRGDGGSQVAPSLPLLRYRDPRRIGTEFPFRRQVAGLRVPYGGTLYGHETVGITVVIAHNPATMKPTATRSMVQPKIRQKLLPLPPVNLPPSKYFSDLSVTR